MLAARVEPKNGPQENKKTGNFKPLVLSQFQAAVDTPFVVTLAHDRDGQNEVIGLWIEHKAHLADRLDQCPHLASLSSNQCRRSIAKWLKSRTALRGALYH